MTIANDPRRGLDRTPAAGGSADAAPPPAPQPSSTRRSRPADAPPPPSRSVDAHIDASIAAAARNAGAARTGDGPSPAGRDGILYVGMNTANQQRTVEANTLRARRSDVDVVTHGEDDKALGPDHVRIKNADGTSRVVGLGTPEGCRDFARTLGLPKAQTEQIVKVLSSANPGSRDELAGIAVVFARGERGESMPGRLVLSGHSGGESVYDGMGDGNDPRLHLCFEDIFALAHAMPRAAAKIEDVMLSACSSGYGARRKESQTALPEWAQHFPNLKTAWGYGGGADFHSPSAGGALQHIGIWEKHTRGDSAEIDAAKVARGVDHWKNVATWSVADGYRSGRY